MNWGQIFLLQVLQCSSTAFQEFSSTYDTFLYSWLFSEQLHSLEREFLHTLYACGLLGTGCQKDPTFSECGQPFQLTRGEMQRGSLECNDSNDTKT